MLQLTKEQINWAKKQIENGQSKESVAHELGVSYNTLMRRIREFELYGRISPYDSRRSIASMKYKRIEAVRIARQLHYPQNIIDEIGFAQNEHDIYRALRTGREMT